MAEASENDRESNIGNGDLSEEQHLKLLQYQEVTASDESESSIEHLKRHNWNLEAAVQDKFNTVEDDNHQHNQPSSAASPTISTASYEHIEYRPVISQPYSVGQSPATIDRQNTWLSWLKRLAYFPVTILQVGISFAYHATTDLLFFIAQLIWPSLGRLPTDPVDDVIQFKSEYEEKYGDQHPTFYLGSYSQVLSDARKELRFLLVYLHSSDSRETTKFCRDVLNNPGFVEYINGNMLFWGCDIKTNEGYKVARAMRSRTYPFLAIVCLRDNKMSVVWRIQGCSEVDEIIATCARLIDENETHLVAARAERAERSFNQVLRNEQDVAFLQSLAEDQKKEAEKKKLVEQQKLEELEKENKKNEKYRKLQEIKDRREEARCRIATVMEPSSTDVGALRIRIKLPNGEFQNRHFLKTDRLKLLYDFVTSNENSPADFTLCTHFPKNIYTSSLCDKTLEELCIKHNTVLLVQNITEESSSDDDDSDE